MTSKLLEDLSAAEMASIPRVVDALREVHEGRAPNPIGALLKTALKPAPVETRLFGAVRAGVETMQREAKRHAEYVDRLIGAEAAAPSPKSSPFQETLYLQGCRGGRTAGRFRCFNRRAQAVEVASLLRPFTLEGSPATQSPALVLRPGGFYLAAGESRIVEVEADLAICGRPGRYESSLDLLMNGAVTLKLWIEIDVYV